VCGRSAEILPDSGQESGLRPPLRANVPGVPSFIPAPDDLLQHVMRTTGLPAGSAARVIADVKAYFDESVEDFVRRRHRELQAGGLTNDPIFERIQAELRDRPVAAPELTARQLRRIVYG
jgi:hypothetical protein